MDKVNNFFWT